MGKSLIFIIMCVHFEGVLSFRIIRYVFAATFTIWHHDRDPHNEDEDFYYEFGTLLYSFLSLFAILVYDDAFSLIRNTWFRTWYMGALTLFWMCLGGLTLVNMLVGIIVDIV